ncbi:DUF2249 domain-containing protein [Actinotalea sp.]|uniref:DUF2249 domain-containing protein n=1 Tax=Actinotalea sp. TaxID=1872145 RepID=UPI00356AD16D
MDMLPIVTAEPTAPTEQAEQAGSGGCGCGGCGCGAGGEAVAERAEVLATDLDARLLDRSVRHATIIAAVAALEPGESLVLANDHDPKPLRAQLAEREPGQLTWDYLAQGPEIFRIQITRVPGHCC